MVVVRFLRIFPVNYLRRNVDSGKLDTVSEFDF